MSVVVLILIVIGLLERDLIWGIFPLFAGILGTYFTLALYADGSITAVSGGVVTVVATASTSATSIWFALTLIPMMFTIAAFLISLYKVSKGVRI